MDSIRKMQKAYRSVSYLSSSLSLSLSTKEEKKKKKQLQVYLSYYRNTINL